MKASSGGYRKIQAGASAWFALLLASGLPACGQTDDAAPKPGSVATQPRLARRFLSGRTLADGSPAARALSAARAQHLNLMQPVVTPTGLALPGLATPRVAPLSAPWTAVGPIQVASQAYGNVTGRVSSIAIDPADLTGNTVYLGTTGGGVWKSTNAAGPVTSVLFLPLTDTLPVFSANGGSSVIPSLSIGAVSVGDGVVLAGTGDPNDASDSYYGEGILRSSDGGVTWTLIQQSKDGVAGNHSFLGLGTAGFAWSTATPALVVVAMSQATEGVLVNAPNAVEGLYYSSDAGATWQMSVIMDGSQTVQTPTAANNFGNPATAVVWNARRQMFYAAVRHHGYYGSPDGRVWTRLANQPGTGLTTAACPPVPNGIGSSGCPIFRGVLAVQTGTGDTFALTIDSNNLDQGLWQDVCGGTGTSCAASPIAFGTRLVSTPMEVGGGSTVIPQADYNLALAAVGTGSGATADTLLFAGTEDLYRCSLAAGCVLRNTTNAVNGCAAPAMVSPAQHAIVVLAGAGSGTLVYLGNDGGAWRSVDGVAETGAPCSASDASHFQNLNGGLGSLAEVVSFAEHPTDRATLLVGLGANGTAGTGAAGITVAWPQISTGEGGTVAIDQTNPANWYVSTEAGVSLRYCGNGNACTPASFAGAPTIGYAQTSNDVSLIDEPFLLDPALTSDILIGTCRAWRGPAQSGASWPGSNAIAKLFGGPLNMSCGATNPVVRSLGAGGPASGSTAAQDAGSTVLYAGLAGSLDGGITYGGHVFGTYAAGSASSSTAWTDLAKSQVTNDSADALVFNPGGFDISSVVADAHDATGKTVYATVMGFTANGVNAPHVYRSTNGGGSWVDISSNLPNAPANALLIDPNSANTVYVAMDTGMYVTTAVTTCTSANCWSVFGTALPNAPVVGLAASAGMATGDGRFGELRASTYGRGIWEIPLVTAAAPAAPAMTLNPTSLTFTAQSVGTASAAQTITVTNSGNAALTVSLVATAGDFSETDTCVGVTVAPNTACSVQVTFLPAVTGTRTGVLTIYGNVAGGQATAALTGTGAPPAAVVLNPTTLSFASTNIGATSAVQNITISNTGGTAATLGTPSVTGDFAITANTCGATLAAQVGCTVSVVFAPTASGARTGSFIITGSVGTQTASLTGFGLAPATDMLTPLALTFAAQQLNTASATQAVTLTNSGDAALTVIAAQIASGPFTVVNGCGNSLNGHSSCSLVVAFVPKAVGPNSGLLTVSDIARSQTVTLNGTGVAPAGVSLSPVGGIAYAATGVGLTSAAQTVVLTNNGGLPLTIQSMAAVGDFTVVAGTNTCGATLAAASACSLQLVFTPTVAGARTGSFSVIDSAASSPQSLLLTGTGVDFTLAANSGTTQTITAGSSAVYGLLLSSAAGVPGTVAFTCTGVPAHATCTVTPASPSLGNTTPITVTIATSVYGVWLHVPLKPGEREASWLAMLLPVGLLALRRRRVGRLGLLYCLIGLAGCGSSRLIPQTTATSPTNGTPTPSGTYNLVVAGASTGLTRSVNLTLIVR